MARICRFVVIQNHSKPTTAMFTLKDVYIFNCQITSDLSRANGSLEGALSEWLLS